MTTVALIPAHNEADRVAATVRAALSVPGIDRVLVIDDGSTDDTSEEAASTGAQVLRLPENRGKGAALDAGFEAAAHDADVLVLLDADLGESATEAVALLAPVLEGDADMTIAMFPKPPGPAGFGLVKGLARWGIRRLGNGFEATAPLSGQRVLTRAAVDAVLPFAFGYGAEVALTIRALRAGLRVREVPTTMTHAHTGRDVAGFAHRGRQFAHVARALARLVRERR